MITSSQVEVTAEEKDVKTGCTIQDFDAQSIIFWRETFYTIGFQFE